MQGLQREEYIRFAHSVEIKKYVNFLKVYLLYKNIKEETEVLIMDYELKDYQKDILNNIKTNIQNGNKNE